MTADALGISRSQVQYDLADIRKQWRESRLASRDDMVAQELQKLKRLEQEHWDAWDRSRGKKKRSTQEERRVALVTGDPLKKGEPHVVESKSQLVTEERNGDPRHLDAIRAIVADRRKLLGLDPPTKIAPTDPSGENPYSGMGAEELRKLAAKVVGDTAKPEGG